MNNLVSIIVPVYNVSEYLDDCLLSLTSQTYTYIEIILINDGSTDDSPNKCEKWSQKDIRIRYVSKKNEGVGPTRNLGVSIANGQYIMCVDPDDWVDTYYVEKMVKAVVEHNADIAECDFYKVDYESQIKSYVNNNSFVGKEFTREERIIWGNVAPWKMIFKKSFLINNHIQQPALPAEDLAVYAFIVVLANKIVSVNKPLYYYRKYRPGAITLRSEYFMKAYESMQYLINLFKKRNLFNKYKDVLYQQGVRWISRNTVHVATKLAKPAYDSIINDFTQFMKKIYGRNINTNIFLLGSYNLTHILQKKCVLEKPYNRFQFTSLPAIMSNGDFQLSAPLHRNPYRAFMLKREFGHAFFDVLDASKAAYLVVDFIEERHDLLKINNRYYTKSDVLKETTMDMGIGTTILRDSDECSRIWKKACLEFIEQLKQRFLSDHVILVENILSEQYGNIYEKNMFNDIKTLRNINQILREYYAFFVQNYPGIQVINLQEDELYFTDDQYEYGCYPYHLNELINIKLASQISIEIN